MDIQRPSSARKRLLKRISIAASLLILIALVTMGVSRLEPAAPTVDRASIWVDTVKRGSMLRKVRGPGTLVPEVVRWIPAVTDGRVERILTLPGTFVEADTILVELSNPELEQVVLDADWQLKAAKADQENLRIQLKSQILNQRSLVATADAEYKESQLEMERNQELANLGLVSDLELKLSQARAESRAFRSEMEKERLEISFQAVEAQLAAQRARLEQLRALYKLRKDQADALRVRPGFSGVLQRLPLEVGQQVTPGTNLAQVAVPNRLKAELRIPATQARDIQIDLKAEIDTRNGIIPGRVIRIDPAVQEGTVTVDVALEGELPKGARPDLNVDGMIEIERLEDVLYVGRPAFGQEESLVGLFKLTEDGASAERTQVQLGKSSVNTIEIREGLEVGDQVILSDMAAWDEYDRVRLR